MTANQNTRLKPAVVLTAAERQRAVLLLTQAAGEFIHKTETGTEIWAASRDWFFEAWGRDTFISLPGLLLSTGRWEEAKSVVVTFAAKEKNGLIPNRILPEKTLYNTVDASLWFVLALKKYQDVTGDTDFVTTMWPTVQNIVTAYQQGTTYEHSGIEHWIGLAADGLLDSPRQATWMDADPSGNGQTPVTPRFGKAVEINALWYGALQFVQSVEPDPDREKYLKDFRLTFNRRFWNASEECLLDVVDGDPHAGALRPNQVLAISQAGDLLSATRQRKVLASVTHDLLTPGGLRTLSPRDSHYHGDYDTTAPMHIKDWAYHQGTVWPWLLGPYIDALFITRRSKGKYEDAIKAEALSCLDPLLQFVLDSEHRSLPEVFSGDNPYEPGGTRSQAWSVAEILRVMMEYRLI